MSLYENNNNIQVLIITDDNIVSATYPFGPGGLRAPPVVVFAMRIWPLLLPTFGLSFSLCSQNPIFLLFGPGGLRAPPVVVDGSEAGHCFHLLFFFFIFSMSSAQRFFFFSQLAFSHGRLGQPKSLEYFFFFLFFFLLRLLLFTHFGETPVGEVLFPPIFWHKNRRNI